MGQLVRFEMTKLLKKKLVYVTLGLFSVIMIVMLFSWVSGNEWARLPSGEMLFGQEAADYNEELTLRYQGALTDEKVQEILNEFSGTVDSQLDILNQVYTPIASVFANADGSWNGKTVAEAFPEFEEPLVLCFSSRWEALLYSRSYVVLLAGLVIIIVISPVFSEEYTSGMDALILTSEKGKRQCVKAKIIASFLFSLFLVITILALGFSMLFLAKGFVGWNSDIQLSELLLYTRVRKPLKCYEAALLMSGASILSTLTLNGLVLAFSAVSKTSFTSIVAVTAVYVVPMFLNPGNPALKRFIAVMPVNSMNISQFLKAGGFSIAGTEYSLFWAILLLAIVVGTGSVFFCRHTFSTHQVA